MTRDLPFDDAADTEDNGGDAAYRIANGVARVARAGAYVTGGALIAAGGSRGGTPAITHDSQNTGLVNDPQPQTPSPTITFPDLTPDSIPPHHGSTPVLPVNAPFAHLDGAQHGTDAGMFPTSFDAIPQPETPVNGFHGLGLPDNESAGMGLPTYGTHPNFTLPTMGNEQSDTATAQPHLPTLDQQQPAFQLPGTTTGGFHLPGTDGMHLPGLPGAPSIPGIDTGHAFDGIGGTPGQGTGVFVGTDWSFDAHVGLDGAWVHSNLSVNVGVGAVGHQLDAFGQQLGQGISHVPENTTLPNNGGAPSLPGATTPKDMGTPFNSPGANAPANAIPGHGTSTIPGSGNPESPTATSPTSAVPGANSPIAPGASSAAPLSSSTAPAGALGASSPAAVSSPLSLGTAPAAPAPITLTPAPAPVAAPVAPAPVAPAVVVPVAVAQPVTVTPLQTTIQPDAANQPIANLLSTHGGPSPLTAPAAVAPALFDHGRAPVLASSEPNAPGHPTTLVDKSVPLTAAPTPAPHVSTPEKVDPSPVFTTVPVPTKIPGLDTDITKPGGTPVTTPVTPPTNTGGKDDTTKPHTPTDDAGTRGGTPTVTVPTDDAVPTHQPTVTNPAHPTQPEVSVPTVAPTVPDSSGHGGQPSVSVAPVPTTMAPVPTQAPLTTVPHVDPVPAKPIADQYDSSHHGLPVAADAGTHALGLHDGGLLTHDAGLFSAVVPDATVVDTHSPVFGPGDHTLLL
ncbi:hypothetical protein VMT65_30125 [Nocardia sp. CDC153]|uniref:hypothetical protein n=1 Tax=Nocardia sp. CDC153 TaxID=3112167 RepID=UPI002DB77F7B|nr:hypothetical protein [Nocardia sp. CDC153]MEC3957326.1 hypothetical protein [Nocardia sp. CDC153]